MLRINVSMLLISISMLVMNTVDVLTLVKPSWRPFFAGTPMASLQGPAFRTWIAVCCRWSSAHVSCQSGGRAVAARWAALLTTLDMIGRIIYIYLVGGLEPGLFFYKLGMIIPTD